MKAMILAAGYGTRLLPYTKLVPKPLFTLNSKAVIEYHIENLLGIGCRHIVINTHHLAGQMNKWFEKFKGDSRLTMIHEPQILDTGGALLNAEKYLDQSDFFVINADIACCVDLKQLWDTHQMHGRLATLLLCDSPDFNKVGIDKDGFVTGFEQFNNGYTFTGIQVLSPEIFKFFPSEKKFSSIFVYKTLIDHRQVKACHKPEILWSDIGTPESYQKTSALYLCQTYFDIYPEKLNQIQLIPLAGDGSDRKWYRAFYKDRHVIIADHGICMPEGDNQKQLNAFIRIGCHLNQKRLQTPQIYSSDDLSGMVLVEDLGDDHLADAVQKLTHPSDITALYSRVIDGLIEFSIHGFENFNPEWTCQTRVYDKNMILKYECQYFLEAFVNDYCGLSANFHEYQTEFEYIAKMAEISDYPGLMHRDFQSRNIMIHENRIFFIDFQSARKGPIQYDLASLLIDPYVMLPKEIRDHLAAYAMKKLRVKPDRQQSFMDGFKCCCITRNLQFLGAFAFLSRVKNKKQFERYIPDAVNLLQKSVQQVDLKQIPKLSGLIHEILRRKKWKQSM